MAVPRTSKEWYADNRVSYNAGRRKRYQTDDAFRARERERARTYQARRRQTSPDGRTFCTIDGQRVEVFPIGSVARLLGVRAHLIRALEARNLLPKPTATFKRRYYTRDQIGLMAPLLQHCKSNARRMRSAEVRVDLEDLSRVVHEEWRDVDDVEG